jgi:hypothetical protein
VRRRGFLLGTLGALGALPATAWLGGCGGASREGPPPGTKPRLHPLKTGPVDALMALAGLRWVILTRPREIAAIPWLIPSIGAIVPEANFVRFAQKTGIDLRQLPEAAVASYAGGAGAEAEEVMLYVARHTGDPAVIEQWLRSRVTSDERRSMDRPDVVRIAGKIGRTPHTLALLGREAFAYQEGGSASKGPARIAALFAEGKLKRSPTALSIDPLRSLAMRFGSAPARAFALGPFEGELARGARGLLAGATAIGAAARPSVREGIALAIAVAGDFSASGPAASSELLTAWNELANGSFGHLLGLDQPVEPPLATHSTDAVAVAVELSPKKLSAGLAAATGSRIDEIMR